MRWHLVSFHGLWNTNHWKYINVCLVTNKFIFCTWSTYPWTAAPGQMTITKYPMSLDRPFIAKVKQLLQYLVMRDLYHWPLGNAWVGLLVNDHSIADLFVKCFHVKPWYFIEWLRRHDICMVVVVSKNQNTHGISPPLSRFGLHTDLYCLKLQAYKRFMWPQP